jgi:hypothetical protein
MYGMMGGVEKTTVYLTAEQKAALARAAAAEGRSEARLIRAGIDVVTAAHQAAETVAASSRTPAGPAGTLPPGSEAPPRGGRPRWLPRDDFVRAIVRHQADPALGRELHELAPDTTDETRAG